MYKIDLRLQMYFEDRKNVTCFHGSVPGTLLCAEEEKNAVFKHPENAFNVALCKGQNGKSKYL